jgi:hypothetical protein
MQNHVLPGNVDSTSDFLDVGRVAAGAATSVMPKP